MDQTKTGKLIRSLRLEKGMTQLELAESIGVSDKAVSKWERGCRTSRTARCCGTAHGLFALPVDTRKK